VIASLDACAAAPASAESPLRPSEVEPHIRITANVNLIEVRD
jgi:hypothetical protein